MRSTMMPTPTSPSQTTPALWEAIMRDTESPVFMVDLRGSVQRANPAARAFLLSASQSDEISLTSGLPDATATELLRFIRTAAESESPIVVDAVHRGRWVRLTLRSSEDPDTSAQLVLVVVGIGHPESVQPGARHIRASHDDLGQLEALTPRELEILKLIALGLSTNDIAKVLYRSVKTVEGHRVSLGSKLNITNRVELARIALRSGLVTLDTPVPVASEGDD